MQHHRPPVLSRPAAAVDALSRCGSDLSSLYQPDDEEQDHRPDGGVNNGGNNSAPDVHVQNPEQPGTDERADDTDDDVADQAKSHALDDHAGQPAGDRADDQ